MMHPDELQWWTPQITYTAGTPVWVWHSPPPPVVGEDVDDEPGGESDPEQQQEQE